MARPHPNESLHAGDNVGHFLIEAPIGVGGMGVVYRAYDTELGRLVAVKLLSEKLFENETARQRFLREAHFAASVTHPNVATVHEIGEQDGMPFIAMEFVQGVTLKHRIGQGPLPFDEILTVGCQTCEALSAAHRHGIVHRDIKSSNIMLTPEGRVKVLDFGLAKAVAELSGGPSFRTTPRRANESESPGRGDSSHVTESGVALGTPSYMSPEQASGIPVDARSDIFSLGVVLYEAASGALPFRGNSADEVLDAIRSRDPTPVHLERGDVPRSFSRVLDRCLAKRANDRFPTADALHRELSLLRDGSFFSRRVRSLALAASDWMRPGRRLVRAASAVLVAAVLAYGIFAGLRGSDSLFSDEAHRWMMVSGFENRTGDEDFDRTIEDVLRAGLDESRLLKAVGREQLAPLLAGMGLTSSARSPDRRTLREACLRGGIPILVTGHIARLGSEFVVTIRLWNVGSDEEIASFQERATGKEEVLPALDRAVAAITRRAGPALRTVEAPPGPAQLWTSSSWDALRLYSEAVDRHMAQDHTEAIALLERAIVLDPDFAMGYARLARIYTVVGEVVRANEAFEKALERLERLTPKEQSLIRSEYRLANGSYGEAVAELRSLASLHSLDPDIHETLGWALWLVGDYSGALESLERASELTPVPPPGYLYETINLLLFTGDLDRARVEIERAEAEDTGAEGLIVNRGHLALLEGRTSAAVEEYRRLLESRNPYFRGASHVHAAKALALAGRYRDAEEELQKLTRLAQAEGIPSLVPTALLLRARMELDRGRPETVRALVNESLDLPLDPWSLGAAGSLLTRAGFPGEARGVLETLEASLQERNPSEERLWLRLRAEVALAEDKRAEATDLMARAVATTPAPEWSEPLARILLEAGETNRALQEYERLAASFGPLMILSLGLGGEILGTAVYAEALYRIASIHERRGDAERARAHYLRYLEVRKDADADLPHVIAARGALQE